MVPMHPAVSPSPRPSRCSISCIIPAYNESASLSQLLPRLHAVLADLTDRHEIIVVNDGSSDATSAVVMSLQAAYPGLVLIELSRNFGKEAALSAGLDQAHGDAVILLDADGQHPVDLIPRMVAHWREGIDTVYAVRRTREDQSAFYVLGTRIFYRLLNAGTRMPIPVHAGDFRLMDRAVADTLRQLPERNRFMKGLYAWAGFSSLGIDYEPLERLDGKSRFGLWGGLKLATTGLIAFSTFPLKLVAALGALLSLGSMGYILWILFEYIYWGISVPGYATLIVSIMFFSGVQLLALGVLSAYVARVYEETKRRPVYVLRRKSGPGLGST